MNELLLELELRRQIEIEEELSLIKNKYWKYVEYVHDRRWKAAKHLLFVCDKIQEFIETDTGHAYDILIFSMPPQHGKSMTITETLPSWYMGRNSQNRVILGSYNDDTAERFTRRNKEKIRQYGKQLFDIEISKTIDRATEFELSNNVGRMISRGIKGGITSNPANLIIIDDPVKNRQEADSETYREGVWAEWQDSIKTRLAAKAKIILIQTRWHEDDLAGRVIINEKNVTVINLPCEAEENDPLGRNVGEALAPEIGKDTAWMKDFKQGYTTVEGSRSWTALFQGHPTAEEGNMIKKHWFRYWKYKGQDLPPVIVKDEKGKIIYIDSEEIPEYLDEQIQSWDLPFKGDKDNDLVAGGVFARRLASYYLLDCINENLDLPDTLKAIEAMSDEWPKAHMKLVEDKANGPAVIQLLHRKLSGLIPVNPEGGKVARLNAVSPAIESGNFYLPHPAMRGYGWVTDYIKQMCGFPNVAHDDMVDMTSQALNKLIYKTRDTEKIKKHIQGGKYLTNELLDKGYTKLQIKKMQETGEIILLD